MQRLQHQIVHLTPQRIRMRIPRLLDDADYAKRLYYWVSELMGVDLVRVNVLARSLIVQAKDATDSQTLLPAIERAIQEATLPVSVPTVILARPTASEPPLQRLVLPTLALSLALMAAALEFPIPLVLLGGITLYAAVPLLTRAAQNALRGEINSEVLESAWTVLHSFHGEFIAPTLSMTLTGTAHALREATGEERILTWRHLIPVETVQVLRQGQTYTIPLEELRQADTLLLYPGELNPIDGVILDGEGLLDISTLTGEPTPVPCCPEERILAGSLVLEGRLQVLVERLSEETEYAQDVHIADRTPLHRTNIAEYAEEVGNAIMLPSLGFAGVLFLLTADVARSLAPLQLDLSTGISISAPTTVLSTIERAKQMGIHVRSGYALETLTKADTVVFSKTGTLTQGTMTVVAVEPPSDGWTDCSEAELLALAASVKRGLRHPVGEAIVRYAHALGIENYFCENWQHHRNHGLGVSAWIEGRAIQVGTYHYLASEGIDLSLFDASASSDADGTGFWYVYVARDGQPLGRIACCDEVRPESKAVIQALRDRGLTVHLVTHNSQTVAHTVADWLALPHEFVHADASPADKVKMLQTLQAEGKTVVYLGEGMDDYAALRASDVAICTDRSCPLIREIADLMLPYGDLNSLLTALDLAGVALDIIHQNITLIAVPNISIVVLGVLFALDPILAVVLNQSANLLAELNGLRPLVGGGDRTPSASAKLSPTV